jgi:hypothetical protein
MDGWLPVTFLLATVIYADSTARTTGPWLPYAAIGAGSLRATRTRSGHAAISNLRAEHKGKHRA